MQNKTKILNLYFGQKDFQILSVPRQIKLGIQKKDLQINKEKRFLKLTLNAYNQNTYLPILQFKIPNFLNIQRSSFRYFLQKGLIEEFKKYNSIQNSDQTFEVFFYPEHYKLNRPKWSPKQAVLKKKSYSCQLYLPVQLSNYKTEEVHFQWVLLANLPLMTKHGHFILNGCPRVLMNQVVRSPGVYFRKMVTKNEKTVYSADFIAQRGSWLRLEVDPKKGDIWAKLKKSPKIPIFIFLRSLGLTLPILNNSIDFRKLRYLLQLKKEMKSSKKIKDFIGPGINNSLDVKEFRVLLKNLKNYIKPKPLQKLTKGSKTKRNKEWLTPFVCATYFQSLLELSKKLYPQKKFLEFDLKLSQKFLFRKFQNPRTYDLSLLGRSRINKKLGLTIPDNHTVLTSQDVLFACLFLMDLLQGLVIADDIDDLKNRKINPCGELIQIQFASGLIRLDKSIREKLKQSKQEGNSVENLFNVKPLNQSLREFFGTSPLSQLMDQTNALSELTHKRRLSSLGPGGINRETASMAIRGIHPTHYGRICPIETPEGQNAGLVNSFTIFSHLNNKGFIETPFYKTYKGFIFKNQNPFLFSSDQERDWILAPGDIKISLFQFLPKNVSIPARQFNEFKRVPRNLINFSSLSPIQMISVATSLIPFLEHNDGNRALMGSNMQRQAVSTLRPSKPIVGTGLESRVISDVGHGLQVQQSGFVSYVDGRSIIIYSKIPRKPSSFFENQKSFSFGASFIDKTARFSSLFPFLLNKKKPNSSLDKTKRTTNLFSFQKNSNFLSPLAFQKKKERSSFKAKLKKSATSFRNFSYFYPCKRKGPKSINDKTFLTFALAKARVRKAWDQSNIEKNENFSLKSKSIWQRKFFPLPLLNPLNKKLSYILVAKEGFFFKLKQEKIKLFNDNKTWGKFSNSSKIQIFDRSNIPSNSPVFQKFFQNLNQINKYNFRNYSKRVDNNLYSVISILPFQLKDKKLLSFNSKQISFIYKSFFLNDFVGQFELANLFCKKGLYSKSKRNFKSFISKTSLFLIYQSFHQKLLFSYSKVILNQFYFEFNVCHSRDFVFQLFPLLPYEVIEKQLSFLLPLQKQGSEKHREKPLKKNAQLFLFKEKHMPNLKINDLKNKTKGLIKLSKKYEKKKPTFNERYFNYTKSQITNIFWYNRFTNLSFMNSFQILEKTGKPISRKKNINFSKYIRICNKRITDKFSIKLSNVSKYKKNFFNFPFSLVTKARVNFSYPFSYFFPCKSKGKKNLGKSIGRDEKPKKFFQNFALFCYSKGKFKKKYFNFFNSFEWSTLSFSPPQSKKVLKTMSSFSKMNPFVFWYFNFCQNLNIFSTIRFKPKFQMVYNRNKKKFLQLPVFLKDDKLPLLKRNLAPRKNLVFHSFPISSKLVPVFENLLEKQTDFTKKILAKQKEQLCNLCQVKKTSKKFIKSFVKNKFFLNQLIFSSSKMKKVKKKLFLLLPLQKQGSEKHGRTEQKEAFSLSAFSLFDNNLTPQKYSLNNYHRSNQDTYMIHRPVVQEGQWVEKGDILADSSASMQGELSIGHNLLVGYTPWEGYNFEDAVLISEKLIFDDLYTSLHIERYEVEVRDTQFGLEQITNQIPNAAEYNYLDQNGIAKTGSWVTEGDILVGKIAPIDQKNLTPYENLLYDIIGKEIPKTRDTSLRVPKNVKGRVIHVEIVETIRKKIAEALEPSTVLLFPFQKKINNFHFFNRFHRIPSQNKQNFSLKKKIKHVSPNKLKTDFFNKKVEIQPKNKTTSYLSKTKLNRVHFLKTRSLFETEVELFNKNEKLHQTILQTKIALLIKKPVLRKILKKRVAILERARILKLSARVDLVNKKTKTEKILKIKKILPNFTVFQSEIKDNTWGKAEIGNTKSVEKKKFSGPQKVHIYLAEKRKLQIGDKIAGRHGNKGIISNILPRQDMPYLPDGTPLDIVLNPLGVPSRMNVGQIFECLLGIAGYYLKQNYKIQPFDEIYGCEASRSLVYSKLYEARIKTGQDWLFNPNYPGKIRLFDGRTGDCFEQPVTVGVAYILKLIHLVDDKIHARSTGPYSFVTQQPLRGRSKQGGQRVGEMEVWALEGFGAAYILQEILTIKSDDLKGRNQIMTSILNNEPLSFGLPESFKVLVRELQSLCLDIAIYKYGENGTPTKININNFW